MNNKNTELVAHEDNKARAVSIFGASVPTQEGGTEGYTGYPRLTVISNAEVMNDDTGKPEPVVGHDGTALGGGTFHINGTDLYSKSVTLKPLLVRYRYLKYDDDFNVTGRTVYFESHAEANIRDTLGTMRLGRPVGKAFNGLPDKDKRAWRKNTPSFMHVFGIAHLEGGPEEGIPVDFRVSGLKFGAMMELIGNHSGTDIPPLNIDIETEYASQGANTWYNIVPTLGKPDEWTDIPEDIMETGMAFREHINDENDLVLAAYNEAKQTALSDIAGGTIVDALYSTPIDDDPLPFDKG